MHKKPTTRGSQQRLTQTRGSKERFKELHAQLFNKFPRELLIALELEDPKDFPENLEELQNLKELQDPRCSLIARLREAHKDRMAGTGFKARWVESNCGKGTKTDVRTDDCAMIPEFSK